MNVRKGALKPSREMSLWAKDFTEQLHLFTEGAEASILQRGIEGLYFLSIELHEGDKIIIHIFFFPSARSLQSTSWRKNMKTCW